MEIYLVLFFMAFAVFILFFRPLRSTTLVTTDRSEHEIEIYKDQLEEVSRDLERGLLQISEAEAVKLEISRKLIRSSNVTKDAHIWTERRRGIYALVVSIFVPTAGFLAYLAGGSPGFQTNINPIALADVPQPVLSPELGAEIARLSQSLETNPHNLANWIALGKIYSRANLHGRAAEVFLEAAKLSPQNAELFARAGEAMVSASKGTLSFPAIKAFENAIRIEPKDPRSRYYLALGKRQSGQLERALEDWLSLEADSPSNAPWLTTLRVRIASVARELGKDPEGLMRPKARVEVETNVEDSNVTQRGPDREQIAAAQNMSAKDRSEMIRGMVDGLAERLKSAPDDLEGWKRLARARKVLGDKKLESTALRRVAELEPKNIQAQLSYLATLSDLGILNDPPNEQLKPLIDRIFAIDAKHPKALWLSGVIARSEGRDSDALRQWSKLLSTYSPNSVDYNDLKDKINELKK